MNDSDRHRLITEMLLETPFASVRDLQERLGVSPATIRRDIDKLHEIGKARKVYGGISANDASATGRLSARPYDENRDIAVDAKRAIAEKAAGLVRDGDSIIVHAGSTCYQLGQQLARRNVRVYTNSMPLAAYLGEHGTCHLTLAGGELYREPGIIHDPSAGAPDFFASRFFLGTQGISAEGLLESHPLLTKAIGELSTRADEIVLLADSRKFSIQPRNIVLPLSRIGTIVTDDGLSDSGAKMLEDAGITILIAAVGVPS
ncbi:DeoR/GlpR transcriptional regulator (plasmid) [Rhizobium grahamii]|uniref:DeoR/GlpR transcriptional regulator n=1 Tax=Rhizobium grahamii TaxID=1120045 RepID=A0A5Q0CGN8_9HYPH|nr:MULTISPECIES: DeoR/GlpR family DNA-binding transcription regulator [Rhizobium]QFY63089.1 DeoR/GlpR transcriptional regulator [Rhizobium grahamii]QRM52147.1 DeoR/GlpR transcriptional regulator [Rhizobium sp. BG6]